MFDQLDDCVGFGFAQCVVFEKEALFPGQTDLQQFYHRCQHEQLSTTSVRKKCMMETIWVFLQRQRTEIVQGTEGHSLSTGHMASGRRGESTVISVSMGGQNIGSVVRDDICFPGPHPPRQRARRCCVDVEVFGLLTPQWRHASLEKMKRRCVAGRSQLDYPTHHKFP